MNLIRHLRAGVWALALALCPAVALAQSTPVFQSGTMTAGDLAKFYTNGLIGDAGGLLGDNNGKGLNPFSVTDKLGLGVCANSAATGGTYYAFCLGHDTSGNALLTVDAFGGAASKGFNVRVNGSIYPFPGNGQGNVLGPNSTTVGDISCFNNLGGTLLSDCGPLSALATVASLSAYAPLASPTFTGAPLTTTDGANNASTRIASQQWVSNWYAPLLSPTFTGTPTAPTAGAGTNTTQLATTAFVTNAAKFVPTISTQTASQASGFTVVNGHDHQVVHLTGATGGQTATVSALGAYSDSAFSVGICNDSIRRWTIASADSGNLLLYPGQCNALQSNGSALKYAGQARRYFLTAPILYVAAAGCSDSNDGLVVGAPFCHVNNALAEYFANYDTGGTNPLIQLADGTYTECMIIAGTGVGWKDGVAINGNAITPSNVVLLGASGCNPVFARDNSIVFLNNLEIACPSPVLSCVNSSQNSTVDLTNITAGSSTNQALFAAAAGGHIDLDGGLIISGNAAQVFYASGPNAWIEATSQVIAYTGAPAWSVTFFEADGTGSGGDFAGTTFAGTGATGNRAIVANNGELRTGGHCTTATLNSFTFLPGSSNLAGQNGGVCD